MHAVFILLHYRGYPLEQGTHKNVFDTLFIMFDEIHTYILAVTNKIDKTFSFNGCSFIIFLLVAVLH